MPQFLSYSLQMGQSTPYGRIEKIYACGAQTKYRNENVFSVIILIALSGFFYALYNHAPPTTALNVAYGFMALMVFLIVFSFIKRQQEQSLARVTQGREIAITESHILLSVSLLYDQARWKALKAKQPYYPLPLADIKYVTVRPAIHENQSYDINVRHYQDGKTAYSAKIGSKTRVHVGYKNHRDIPRRRKAGRYYPPQWRFGTSASPDQSDIVVLREPIYGQEKTILDEIQARSQSEIIINDELR